MKYLVIFIIIATLLAVSIAHADVCIEQPPGEVVCVPESPVNPVNIQEIFLPIARRDS